MNVTKMKPKSHGVSTLSLITLLFLGSAALRVFIGADSAIAQATLATETDKDEEYDRYSDVDTFSTPAERERLAKMLDTLQTKEAQLNAREAEQNKREANLEAATAEVSIKLAELKKAEENLRKTISITDGAAEGDLSKLTAVYENMKPKDAAALFEAMEPDFAAGFLSRMRPDAAANVMAGLPPEFAYSISVLLAGRNANAPKS
ncbi:MotE family protein [Roseobacter sp. GAI101]|uniref:MotE family protein n=1 Tax=Roseobacter sp. (strain GAI101) TaxID=391589 RepID=UPI0001872356|nr:hypothetical protein [Roseobacter sp. GAI101]EEB84621.1 conserved hypothetical protein [Roseobacter sp. GAI101]